MTSPSAVTDKSPKPPGLLPKNVQSWLLVGLAVLMVMIMWLTGEKKRPTPAHGGLPALAVQAPPEVNEAKIVELQNRIQQLQREQAIAASALARGPQSISSGGEAQAANSTAPSPQNTEAAIQEEREKRKYLSLFASNVALSYRKNPESSARFSEANLPGAPIPDTAELATLLRPLQPPTTLAAPAKESAENGDRKQEQRNSPVPPANTPSVATGKMYLLFEGTILETVLLNRLDGQFSGPIECLLTGDVYSHDRQHLLIPSGTRILGEARKVESFGQTRLAVFFHRLIMPDGYSATLDRFQGLNQIGDAGLRDQVNNHYVRLFGVSLAIGAIGAVAESGTVGTLTASGSDLMRQGFAQSMGQSSAQILDRFLNVLPTITIREGHRVKVYLSSDLALPDYANHTMPSNL
jgi:type IV secretory pathway VirB10-like protein